MSKTVQTPKSWTKPELVKLGTIADVAAQGTGPNQCGGTGGGCVPKS
ncbi:MAG: hypothetical protein ACKOQ3_04065 [Novosphingobium sp.]